MVSSLIYGDSSNENNGRINLTGIDMVPASVENVFVYPYLDVKRFEKALSRTISDWPIVVGRLHIINNEDYIIQLSNNGLPLTYSENDEMKEWPLLPVVVADVSIFIPFVDSVPNEPNENEPLVRFKITHLIHSNEYILGVSFYHMIGDGDTYIHFLSDLSCYYQDIQPVLPRPIFKRHLWFNNDTTVDSSLFPMMRQVVDARQKDLLIADIIREYEISDPIHMSFSSEQLIKLQSLANQSDEHITIQDALTAYLIVKLNKHVFISEKDHIQRVKTIINYRGISNSLSPNGQVDNSIMFMISDDFPNPFCLSNIAKTIRKSINKSRNENFLIRWLRTLNNLMINVHKQGQAWNYVFYPNEIMMNSNWKYDWAGQVDLGMKNQSRFHTTGLAYLGMRVFRLNPCKDNQGNWIRDQQGAQVSFRIAKGKTKDDFINAWKKDLEENFANV